MLRGCPATLRQGWVQEQMLRTAVAGGIHHQEAQNMTKQKNLRELFHYAERHLFRGKEKTGRASQDG
jgi:hypothetical protein